jgi:hypothetical protein
MIASVCCTGNRYEGKQLEMEEGTSAHFAHSWQRLVVDPDT